MHLLDRRLPPDLRACGRILVRRVPDRGRRGRGMVGRSPRRARRAGEQVVAGLGLGRVAVGHELRCGGFGKTPDGLIAGPITRATVHVIEVAGAARTAEAAAGATLRRA